MCDGEWKQEWAMDGLLCLLVCLHIACGFNHSGPYWKDSIDASGWSAIPPHVRIKEHWLARRGLGYTQRTWQRMVADSA